MRKRLRGLIILFFVIGFSFCLCGTSQKSLNRIEVQASQAAVSENVFNKLGLTEETSIKSVAAGDFDTKSLIINGKFDTSSYSNVEKLDENLTVLYFETEQETEDVYYELLQLPDVDVIVNVKEEASITGSFNPYNDWGYTKINFERYNEYLDFNTEQEVVVVVIDSGINTSHEYLKDRILKDSSGNYVGFAARNEGVKVKTEYTYSGYEFEDDNGHGTHVSGIICNSTPSNVKILPIKLMGSGREFNFWITDVIEMFTKISDYAKTYKIACVNMSFGGYWGSSFAGLFEGYLRDYISKKNILPIASAGNDDQNCDNHYPSSFESVVCVAALTESGSSVVKAHYSNYGSSVDISAPGTAILSCGISSSNSAAPKARVYKSGTSMATPYVCAVTALMWLELDLDSIMPTVELLRNKLYENVIDVDSSGWDERTGCGMVNLDEIFGDITYTVKNIVTSYNGDYHNISITDLNVLSYEISYRFETEKTYSTDVTGNDNFKNYTNGQKKVFFKISAPGYKDTTGVGLLTINKATIGIKIDSQTCVYGEDPGANGFSYTRISGTVYNGDSLGIRILPSADNTTPVGEYEINATIANENYALNYTPGVLTITTRPISIKLSKQTFEYLDDLTLSTTAYEVTSELGVVNGDSLKLILKTDAESGKDVGEYYIKIVSYNANYLLTAYEQGVLEVIPKSIDILSSQSGYYGDNPVFDKVNFNTNISIEDKESLKVEFVNTELSNLSDVGEYNLTIKVNNANYTASDSSVAIYTVKQRPITILAKDQSLQYGSINLLQTQYSLISGNLVNGDVIDVELKTTATNTSPVGNNYSITVNCSGDKVNNYLIAKQKGKLIILKREAELKANDCTSVYGDDISLSQTAFVATNIVNGDKLYPTISTNATKTSGVGIYDINISCANANYNFTFVPGILTITKREITIALADQTVRYGSEIKLNQTKYEVSSTRKILSGDNLNIVLSTMATSISPVGNYPITLTYSNDNYDVTVLDGNLIILVKYVTIVLQSQERLYGDMNSLNQDAFTVSTSGINKDILDVEISAEAGIKSEVGYYPLVAISNNTNISLTVVSANYRIKRRPLTVEIKETTCIYGNIDLTDIDYTVSNIANNDDVIINFSTTATNRSSVGNNYLIVASCNNSNYSLNATGKLRIIPKELEINLNNQSGGYYGAIQFNSGDYTLSASPISGDNLNINITTEASNTSSVGDYDITFTYNNSNYIITGNTAKFTVNPRPITIEIDLTCIYGDQINLNKNNYIVTSANKVVSGDNLNLELTTPATNLILPGIYPIDVVCKNNNYSVSYSVAQITINKRQIRIKANNAEESYVYGDDVVLDQNNYSITNLVEGDNINVTLTTQASSTKPVGRYSIVPTYTEDEISSRYIISLSNGSLDIVKRQIDIKVNDQNVKYGEDINLKLLYEITSTNKFVNGDDLNFTPRTSAVKGSSVGDYYIWLEYANNNNYSIRVTKGVLSIEKANIVVTIRRQSGVYGDNIVLDQTAFDTNIEVDKNLLGITLFTTATSTSSIGLDYEIDLTYTNTNYDIVVNKSTFEIMPRQITIEILDQTCQYGSVDELNHTLYVASENPVDDGFGIVLTTSATNNATKGATFEIKFDYTNKNYLITATKLGTLTVVARKVGVDVYQCSQYGENIVLDNTNYSIVSGSVLDADDLNLTMNCLNIDNTTKVGEYEILVNCNNENYELILLTAVYEILPRDITINIIQEKQYGDIINLDPTKYEIVTGNLVGNDTLELKLSTNALKTDNVDDNYIITVEDCNDNYNVVLNCGQFKITKRKIKIASVQDVFYGDVKLNSDNIFFLEGSKAFKSDNLNISLTTDANNASGVGDYMLFMSYDNDNYEIQFDSEQSKLQIKPRRIKISVDQCESWYGDPIVLNGAYNIVSGSIINDDVLDVAFSTSATSYSDVGTYSIICKNNNDNYLVTLTNNIYKIIKRPIIIRLKNQITPNGLMFKVLQNKYDIVYGSIVEGTNLDIVIKTDANASSFFGNYDLTAYTNNDNYDVEIVGAEITIIPAVEGIVGTSVVLISSIVVTVVFINLKRKRRSSKEYFDDYIE